MRITKQMYLVRLQFIVHLDAALPGNNTVVCSQIMFHVFVYDFKDMPFCLAISIIITISMENIP